MSFVRVVPYGDFGFPDRVLYAQYLEVCKSGFARGACVEDNVGEMGDRCGVGHVGCPSLLLWPGSVSPSGLLEASCDGVKTDDNESGSKSLGRGDVGTSSGVAGFVGDGGGDTVGRKVAGSSASSGDGAQSAVCGDDGLGSGVRPGVGPNGGTSFGRGRNYQRNQDARDRKKTSKKMAASHGIELSKRSFKSGKTDLQRSSEPVSIEKTDLQKSSELKWRTQNELAALKAEREIAILKATDLEEEKRKRRAQICASTERNLVSIERFHSDLRKSGNTSSDDDTRVNTVLSASAGSISPSSSVSESDVRKAKKDLEDSIAEKNKLAAALIRMGQNPEAIIGYGNAEVDLDAKTEWTVDSKGRITDDNEAILDVIYPDGYMVIHDDVDFVHPDGKNKVRLVGGPRYSVKESPVEEEDVDDDARTHWSLDSQNVLPHKDALKLIEKFPDGYDQNYDCYSDAVTGRRRGVIRPTAYVPRVEKKLNGLS